MKELGTETHPTKGILKEGKFPKTRKTSHQQVCGEFWNLREQHNWEEKKQKQNKTHSYVPDGNSQQKSSPEVHIHHRKRGLNR